ncbi:hypothetical protein TYRP_023785 [Tyrophagus putrescentiae]|nr:hypothetical protein TYRP_023785 [Tyrophagus putrescentiae]
MGSKVFSTDAIRAKRAGPEETEVDSGSRSLRSRGPRRRKLTVVKSHCNGAQLTTARSDVTWPVSTSVDEGLASEASVTRGDGR